MAVVLNKFEDMNYADIAEVMGLTTKAVKSLLSRARARSARPWALHVHGRRPAAGRRRRRRVSLWPTANTPPRPAGRPGGRLVSYLDGELEPAEAERRRHAHQPRPRAAAEAESLRKTWALLDHLPRPEPSADFTNKTVSRVFPAAATAARSGSRPSRPVVTPPRAGWSAGKWALAAAIILAAGGAGYVARFAVGPKAKPPGEDEAGSEARVRADERILKNLKAYRRAGDIEFLRALDDPHLFGDEAMP